MHVAQFICYISHCFDEATEEPQESIEEGEALPVLVGNTSLFIIIQYVFIIDGL